ncbi:hypothetical protein GQ44DRAFT_713588 [Phaeosphaeriaceae sp. PMI808]|nr:hypothetical protein GQ44DRAFT_713588 [Phaeosphaeriaceae sp. PMI808]
MDPKNKKALALVLAICCAPAPYLVYLVNPPPMNPPLSPIPNYRGDYLIQCVCEREREKAVSSPPPPFSLTGRAP